MGRVRGLRMEKGFGAPYRLALGPTEWVRPLNIREVKKWALHL